MEKNGTPASPATARAMSVLPVPGGPTRSTPLGIFAPRVMNFSGNFRNSTTSCSSSLASSTPATSAKLTGGLLPTSIRARLRPKLKVWLVLPWAWRIMKNRTAPKKMSGRKLMNRPMKLPSPLVPLTTIWMLVDSRSTPDFSRISTMLELSSLRDVKVSPLVVAMVSFSPRTSIVWISSRAARDMTSFIGISLEPPSGSENSVKKIAIIATITSR